MAAKAWLRTVEGVTWEIYARAYLNSRQRVHEPPLPRALPQLAPPSR